MDIPDLPNLLLTTIGRRTGRPHTVELWYTVHDGSVCVSTEECAARDWCSNILHNPAVTVCIGDKMFAGTAALVDDVQLKSEVFRLRQEKYGTGGLRDTVEDWIANRSVVKIALGEGQAR